MSNRPTEAEVQEHYRPNVEALDTADLLRMVKGDGFATDTPKYIRKALQGLASKVAQERGINLPLFASYFQA